MPSSDKPTRKLAAIMFTDIAGFTALSAKDETKALKLLDTQKQILTPIIEKYNGTLHKEMGDGLLFTFQTVTEAVKCGIEIQEKTKVEENLNLRIGIHEGEITLKEGDILGDDVNVASRIEPFSPIGGIAISGKVQQDISSLTEFETLYIGKPKLKGVSQNVEVYCITSHRLPTSNKVVIKSKSVSKKIMILGLITILTLCILFYRKQNSFTYPEHKILSIAVLLPENLSDNNNIINRTIAEDLIIDISHLSSGRIILPSINETLKVNNSDNLRKISKSLHTKYVLRSSIIFTEINFELRCRLIELNTGKSIYSKKWKDKKDNLSTVLEIISIGILNNLNVEIFEYYNDPQNMITESINF